MKIASTESPARVHGTLDELVGLSGFSVIYADPPWKYSFPGTRAEDRDDYPTMSAWQISRLPVERIAGPDCALLMWAIWPRLPDALEVMQAWGFEFKTCAFVWVKANKAEATGQLVMMDQGAKSDFLGMGMWTRSNTEFCLLGVKGKPKRSSASVRQIIYAPLGRHSEKPHETRARIVELFGDVPRIELFARERAEGWEAWGNQLESNARPHAEAVADSVQADVGRPNGGV
jgi:N6-adenosine-specific RNA methylase IME4